MHLHQGYESDGGDVVPKWTCSLRQRHHPAATTSEQLATMASSESAVGVRSTGSSAGTRAGALGGEDGEAPKSYPSKYQAPVRGPDDPEDPMRRSTRGMDGLVEVPNGIGVSTDASAVGTRRSHRSLARVNACKNAVVLQNAGLVLLAVAEDVPLCSSHLSAFRTVLCVAPAFDSRWQR